MKTALYIDSEFRGAHEAKEKDEQAGYDTGAVTLVTADMRSIASRSASGVLIMIVLRAAVTRSISRVSATISWIEMFWPAGREEEEDPDITELH